MSDKSILLKRFGGTKVNKITKGHKVGNLWHVYVYGEWKAVPEEDVKELKINE